MVLVMLGDFELDSLCSVLVMAGEFFSLLILLWEQVNSCCCRDYKLDPEINFGNEVGKF